MLHDSMAENSNLEDTGCLLENVLSKEEDFPEKMSTVIPWTKHLEMICEDLAVDKEECLLIKINLEENISYIGGSEKGTKFLDHNQDFIKKFLSFCNGESPEVKIPEVVSQSTQCEILDDKSIPLHDLQGELKLDHRKTDEQESNQEIKLNDLQDHSVKERPKIFQRSKISKSLLKNCRKGRERTIKRKQNYSADGETDKKKKKVMSNLNLCKIEDQSPPNERKSKRLSMKTNILQMAAMRKAKMNDFSETASPGKIAKPKLKTYVTNKTGGRKRSKFVEDKDMDNKNTDDGEVTTSEDYMSLDEGERKEENGKADKNDPCLSSDNEEDMEKTVSFEDEENELMSSVENEEEDEDYNEDVSDMYEDDDEFDTEEEEEDENTNEIDENKILDDAEINKESQSKVTDKLPRPKRKFNKVTCSECKKKILKSNYPSHLRKVHKKLNAFKCKDCLQSFNSIKALKIHSQKSDCQRKRTNLKPENAGEDKNEISPENDVTEENMNDDKNHSADGEDGKENAKKIKGDTLQKMKEESIAEEIEYIKNNGSLNLDGNKKVYTCNICLRRLKTEEGLENHLITHKENKYQCHICNKLCVNSSRLKIHLLVHKDEKYSCKLCSSEFAQARYLIYHMRKNHDDHRRACYVCGILFDDIKEMNEHLLTHKTNHCSNFVCPKCGRTFELMRYLKGHNRVCHKGNEEICKVCCEFFLTKEDLRKHMWKHRSESSFMCNICKKSFEKSELLTSHLKNEHNSHMYVCETCGQEFSGSAKLKKHMGFEHDESLLCACKLCDAKFIDNRSLKQHVNGVHKEHRSFQCEECGTCFKTVSTMKKHLKTHQSDCSQQCEFCGFKFKSYEGLNNHLLDKHSDQINVEQLDFRVYECEYCGKRSSQKAIHIRHVRTHTGEKPHICTICDKRFPIPAALNRHVRTKHMERTSRYACECCGIRFQCMPHLKRHYKSNAHKQKAHVANEVQNIVQKSGILDHQIVQNSANQHEEIEDKKDVKIIDFDSDLVLNKVISTASELGNDPSSEIPQTIYVISEIDISNVQYVQLESEVGEEHL